MGLPPPLRDRRPEACRVSRQRLTVRQQVQQGFVWQGMGLGFGLGGLDWVGEWVSLAWGLLVRRGRSRVDVE